MFLLHFWILALISNDNESFYYVLETRLQFEKYLQNEYSEENLEFWLACDEYRFLSPNLRKETSQRIYDEFLKVSATREV